MTSAAPDEETLPRKLDSADAEAQAEAREQAEQYQSVFASTPLVLDDGESIMIPPHPEYGMLDDEAMDEYDELLFRLDTEYLREDDIFIPEQRLKNKDGSDSGVVLPASTQRGALKRPFRVLGPDGKDVLIKPSHTVRLVQIALGDKDYERLRAGGRSGADVWRIWQEQMLRIRKRQAQDSKSDGGTVAVAPVPKADG